MLKRLAMVGVLLALIVGLAMGAFADPIHVGGGPQCTSGPIHVGGGPLAE